MHFSSLYRTKNWEAIQLLLAGNNEFYSTMVIQPLDNQSISHRIHFFCSSMYAFFSHYGHLSSYRGSLAFDTIYILHDKV